MAFSSFVFIISFFPGRRLPDGSFSDSEEVTLKGWREALSWAEDYVNKYNEGKGPDLRIRINGIVVKIAAFAAPPDFAVDLTPEQLAILKSRNPELANLTPAGAGAAAAAVGTGVPPGYLSIKTPEGWQLVKDPSYTVPPAAAPVDLAKEAASLEKLKADAIAAMPPPAGEPGNGGQSLAADASAAEAPKILRPDQIPSPVGGKVHAIPAGPGIMPPMPAMPGTDQGSMTGPLGNLARAPIATAADLEANNAAGAARLGMNP